MLIQQRQFQNLARRDESCLHITKRYEALKCTLWNAYIETKRTDRYTETRTETRTETIEDEYQNFAKRRKKT